MNRPVTVLRPPAPVLGRGREWRRLGEPLAVGAAALAAVGYVAAVDPNESGHYATCPFLAVTGWFCPGCGALRTVHALTHLDVPEALSLNLFVVATLPLLALWWGRWLYRRWTRTPRTWLAPAWLLWALLVAVVAFGVLRNVPGFEVLAP